jgi:hypothetical protein
MKRVALLLAFAGAFAVLVPSAWANGWYSPMGRPNCDENGSTCTETLSPYNYAGYYTGHDEPSVLFYSGTAGAGNNQVYTLTLPSDPPNQPNQNGTGGTYNFQLHPAFWFGMAMCDDQSAPNPGGSKLAGPQVPCTPNSDSNIYIGTKPTQKGGKNYIGEGPGGAFMEMQFYPPGWVQWPPGDSCDPSKWCAALNIDSFNENQNTGVINNSACLSTVGIEPVNFAFITRSGVAQAPANPVDATLATFTPNPSTDLMMQSGDKLRVAMFDTSAGFKVVINDLTSGQSGSMTASVANDFGQVNFAPNASTCTVTHAPFHPEFSTSSENTRLAWTAHSYNIAFADEIGHFEFCNAVSAQGGDCTSAGVNDPGGLDSDDSGGNGYCFAPPFLPPLQTTQIKVGGCLSTEVDFDGAPYQTNWPGSTTNAALEAAYHPTPIVFTSPLIAGSTAYSRVAFEADLPRIEIPSLSPDNSCNRSTGVGCVNPPLGPNGQPVFYPLYSTGASGGGCTWQLGGPYIPGATNTFGGTSTSEFGPLLLLDYPTPSGINYRYNDFRNVLSSNPC